MYKTFKMRVMPLLLATALASSNLPVTALASETETEYKVGDIVTNTTGVAPNAIDGAVWVAGEPVTDKICGNLVAHTHGEKCYKKVCDHADGHLSTCYSSSTEYALCEHEDDTKHTGVVTLSDVVTYKITYKYSIPKGINIVWKEEHPAYDVIHEKYEQLIAESTAKLDISKKIAAITELSKLAFCFTTTANAEPDLCKHTCSELGGDCYELICILPAHGHTEDCYETTYSWTLCADVNNNGVADNSEKYTVRYVDGEKTLSESFALSYGADTPTIDAPEGEEGYIFDGWKPEVAQKVTAPTIGTTITYTAKWKPDKDENKDGIPDGKQYCTVNVTGNDEIVMLGEEKITFTEGNASKKIDMLSGKHTITITPADGNYLTNVTVSLGGEENNIGAIETKNFSATSATVEIVAGVSQTYNIAVTSREKVATQVNVKENPEVKYMGEKISLEKVIKAVVQSVTAENIEVPEGIENIKVVDDKISKYRGTIPVVGTEIWTSVGDTITSTGTYKFTVYYPGTSMYKASTEVTIEFKVVDGRDAATLTLEDATIEIKDTDNMLVTEEDMLNKLFVNATVGETGIDNPDLSVSYIAQYNETLETYVPIYSTSSLGSIGTKEISEFGKYKITINIAETNNYLGSSATAYLEVVDGRVATTITLKENATLTYSEDMTEEDVYNAVFESLSAEDGSVVTPVYGENMNVVIADMNAGTHTVTVKYTGDNVHAASSATCDITINKADAKVNVTSKTVNYKDVKESGANISELITTTPTKVGCIEFAVGVSLGEEAGKDTAVVTYVNLPSLIDEEKYQGIADAVNKILNGAGSSSMSISSLKTTLESILKIVDNVPGINIDTSSIESIISVLESIEGLNGISELKINLTMGKDIIVKDSGMYITGGVVSDSNYNTAVNVGYLLIAPNATKVKLAFNVNDDNGIITRDAILNKGYDLGSHVVEDGLSEEAVADATAHLKNLYIGVDINGKSVVSETPSAEIGAYTQIALISDLGNEMYYAVPIIRSYVVVADTAIVKFIDENNNENNDRIFTYDGNQHGMTAIATDRAGNLLPSENISYKYIGIEGDGEGYNSSEAPVSAGAYTVIATYLDADHTYVGMAIGAMVISPAEATVTVNDKMHTYDGNAVDVLTMIEKTPEDAKMAVLMAGIDVSGDFSENGWNAVNGVVNIDFPTRVDGVLKTIVPDAYTDGIKLSDFISKVNDVKAGLEEMNVKAESIDNLVSMLSQMSDKVTLTFKEQSDVNPVSIGAYLVGAVIMDPDYKAACDTGVLVITPEITKAELKWNYEDANGVITSPILGSIDLGAAAYVSGTKDDTITGKIQYVFYGVDAEGNEVRTNDASTLPNGIYTQMAYVKAENVSASMTFAAPIMRPIVIVPQTVNVEFIDEAGNVNNDRQFTYDGSPKQMNVRVTQMDSTQISDERLAANLTVRYIGADSLAGAYDSTTPPTNVGAYTVIATYVEKDANGQILYAGANVGAMVIKPQDVTFEVIDTTVSHDGTEKFAEIKNDAGMEYVAVIVDESNNVNIVFPASWGVKTTTVDVSKNIDTILKVIGTLPADAQSTTLIQNLKAVLEKIEINTLTINGTKPVEVGTYKITALAYAANTNVVIDSGVLTITHDWCADYKFSDDKHWKECNYCHEKAEEEAHKDGTASCTEQPVCSVCEQKYGSANGHSFGEWYDVDSPDCENKGSQRRDCSACGHFETKDLNPTGHKWDDDYTVDKEPSCTEEGSKSIHCSVCDAKKDSTPISKVAHTEGEAVKENVVDAKCTTAGSYDSVIYCTKCSTELSRKPVVVAATGHSFGKWTVVKEPTTTETGLKERVCSACGAEETEDIPMKEVSDSGTKPGDGEDGTKPGDGEDGTKPGNGGEETKPGNGGTTTDTTNKDTTNKDTAKSDGKAVQTGDSNNLVIWISLLAVSVAAIFALVRFKRKRS